MKDKGRKEQKVRKSGSSSSSSSKQYDKVVSNRNGYAVSPRKASRSEYMVTPRKANSIPGTKINNKEEDKPFSQTTTPCLVVPVNGIKIDLAFSKSSHKNHYTKK
ncbi:hypothetical protein KPL47_09840 [Clostridium estertheticum]|uniref:hypothetical protein n=1 Tax=Clostridium estertheticum TaxID=238834 RepID=UPI001C0AAEE4|nr:hypothetical protein [Clostridium estertheticum]MBU3176673.1 hypothetical protein [Clostridium estertheticum]